MALSSKFWEQESPLQRIEKSAYEIVRLDPVLKREYRHGGMEHVIQYASIDLLYQEIDRRKREELRRRQYETVLRNELAPWVCENTLTAKPEDQTMNDKNFFAALNPNVCMVHAVFPQSSNKYTFKALKSQELAVDDMIAVDTANGLAIAQVKSVLDVPEFDPNINYKWVVQRLDMQAFERIKEQETKFNKEVLKIERAKRADEIKKTLVERIGQEQVAKLLEP